MKDDVPQLRVRLHRPRQPRHLIQATVHNMIQAQPDEAGAAGAAAAEMAAHSAPSLRAGSSGATTAPSPANLSSLSPMSSRSTRAPPRSRRARPSASAAHASGWGRGLPHPLVAVQTRAQPATAGAAPPQRQARVNQRVQRLDAAQRRAAERQPRQRAFELSNGAPHAGPAARLPQ